MAGKFHYFAYGSNILKERLQLNNPSAVFKTVGTLKGYKLDFSDPGNTRWHGAVATITEAMGQSLSGVIWQMDTVDIPSLDQQEGGYDAIEVYVKPQDGGNVLRCRTYKARAVPGDDTRPSPQYMDVIIQGAIQNDMPQEYINTLKCIEHNNYDGNLDVIAKIGDSSGTSAEH